MKLREYLHLGFPETVLAKYLGVSPRTLKKLATQQPVRSAVLKHVGLRLQVDDATIRNQLKTLNTPAKPFNPPVLNFHALTELAEMPPVLPLPQAKTVFITSASGSNHRLIIAATTASVTLAHRVNQVLYGGHWPGLSACPIDTLSAHQLLALSQYLGHKLPQTQIVTFHNLHQSQVGPHVFPVFAAMLLILSRQRRPTHFVLDANLSKVLHRQVEMNLITFKQQVYAETHLEIDVSWAEPVEFLGLEAANIFARAAAKLPIKLLPTRVLGMHHIESLEDLPLFKILKRLKA